MSRFLKFPDKKKKMLLEMLRHGHTLTFACKELKIDRKTEYNERQKDPDYGKEVDFIRNVITISIVEDSLYSNAVKGNVTAQIFFLVNRSGGRWKNLKDIRVSGDQKNPIIFLQKQISKMGDKAIEQRIEELEQKRDAGIS